MKNQNYLAGALLAILMSATSILNAQTISSTKSAGSARQIISALWIQLANISLPDANNAKCMLDSVGTCTSATACYRSSELRVSGFNFVIPQNGVIDGIKVQIKRKSTVAGAIRDITIHSWTKTAGTEIFGTLAPIPATWDITPSYIDYGGANELWGLTWTPAMINDSAFGFSIACLNISHVIAEAKIDHIKAVVYYHVGPENKMQSRDLNPSGDRISIFPDPANALLNVNIKNETSLQDIQILNTEGQIVFNKQLNSNDGTLNEQIDVSFLPKGIYLMQITSKEDTFTRRFAKE